ncbi:MAG: hypothetical protein OXC07_05620 [Kistimonas sp.]|nr:hypothetical protein [Kistimonas sp.]
MHTTGLPCVPSLTRRQSQAPGEPTSASASASAVAHSPRPAGQHLAAAPEERRSQPSAPRPSPWDSRPFSRDRFTTIIAPWMNRFDSSKTKELQGCSDPDIFPQLLYKTLGEQLRQTSRLRLEPCKAFLQPAGLLVSTAPNHYERLELPAVAPDARSGFPAFCQQGLKSDTLYIAPDQKRFVELCEENALIYEALPDGSFHQTARCHAGQPVNSAQWSPCSQYLRTRTYDYISLWSRSDSGDWKEVIRETCEYHGRQTVFSPDSRSFMLFTESMFMGDTSVHAVNWWCQPDGSWTREPVQLNPPEDDAGEYSYELPGIAFSPDSRTMALSLQPDYVQIWRRLEQGSWTQESVVPLDFPGDDPCSPPRTYGPVRYCAVQDMSFNAHGQLALASLVAPRYHDSNASLESDSDDSDTGAAEPQQRHEQQPRLRGFAIWSPSSHGWKKQAQIVTEDGPCTRHQAFVDRVMRVYFSPDGRCLAAENGCGAIQAWCLVPADPSTAPSRSLADTQDLPLPLPLPSD